MARARRGHASEMDEDERWTPICTPPDDLVTPVRIDPTGRTGPTRHQARGAHWVASSYGLYLPAGTDRSRPEQRILEESMRLRGDGAVTGWAALRLAGAAFFDGRGPDTRPLPVPLLTTRQLAAGPTFTTVRRPPRHVVLRCGIPCVPVLDAVVDEIQRRDDRSTSVAQAARSAVPVIDMACAARITSISRVRAAATTLRGRLRTVVTAACDLASECSRSPRETDLRLVWELDAGMGRPLVNPVVRGLDGASLGTPDLFDPDLGVAGEYDGALHRTRSRHRRDVIRSERFRAHGVETFVVVAGDSTDTQVARMHAARDRARARRDRGEPRGWTVELPSGAMPAAELSLDDELDLRERHEQTMRAFYEGR